MGCFYVIVFKIFLNAYPELRLTVIFLLRVIIAFLCLFFYARID